MIVSGEVCLGLEIGSNGFIKRGLMFSNYKFLGINFYGNWVKMKLYDCDRHNLYI